MTAWHVDTESYPRNGASELQLCTLPRIWCRIWARRGSKQAKRLFKALPGTNSLDGLEAMPCAACGAAAIKRCRFCRAVAYCSAGCAEAHADDHRRTHVLRGVLLPEEGDGGCGEASFDRDTHYRPLRDFAQNSM